MLFRHSIFEIIALFLSIYISYCLLLVANDYINNHIATNEAKSILKRLGLVYVAVIILTALGALFEGSVNVVL